MHFKMALGAILNRAIVPQMHEVSQLRCTPNKNAHRLDVGDFFEYGTAVRNGAAQVGGVDRAQLAGRKKKVLLVQFRLARS